MIRIAVVNNAERQGATAERVTDYLPENYQAVELKRSDKLVIIGEDVAGWTLEDYVIPRLASGLVWATEVDAPALQEVS